MEYKRLTNNNLDEYNPEYDFCVGCEHFGEPNGCNRSNGTCGNYERFMETYNRLAELEDKIEQGTLKEVPEGAVVLEKAEQQKYAAYKIIEPQIRGCLDRERKLIQVVKNAIENMEVWDEYEHERLLEILGINEEEYTEITGKAYESGEEDDNEDE